MDLSKLSLDDGAYYSDEISQLPRRAQDLFFSLFAIDIYKDNKDGMFIIDNILNKNCESLLFHGCKSPIEKIFIFAYEIVICNVGFPISEVFCLYPQEKIEVINHSYIADFLFDTSYVKAMFDHEFKLVIECDGHEFHEKTKEQVEKRNLRDMDLKMAGYDILHFSGSQIYQDPIKCASYVYEYIKSNVGEVDIGF